MSASTLAHLGARNSLAAGFGATSNAYTTGKVIGTPLAITNAMAESGSTGILESICLIDGDSLGGAVDLYFFNDKPTTMGADKATFALSAAEAKTMLLGRISVVGGDYSQLVSTVKEATKLALGLGLASKVGAKTIYVVAVARASLTYTGDTLALRAHILQD